MAGDKLQIRIEATYDGERLAQFARDLRVFAKDLFLYQTIEEMKEDGWDGALFAEDVRAFVHARDGKCPYPLEEIDVWLKENDK